MTFVHSFIKIHGSSEEEDITKKPSDITPPVAESSNTLTSSPAQPPLQPQPQPPQQQQQQQQPGKIVLFSIK